MSQIGGGWTEHFTADGKAYYHHAATQKTTWERPPEEKKLPPSLPSNPPSIASKPQPTVARSATQPPGDLLAAIRSTPKLKKTESGNSPRAVNGTGRVIDSHNGHQFGNSNKEASSSFSARSNGGGGLMGELASAMNRRSSTSGRTGPPALPNSSPSVPAFHMKGRPNGIGTSSDSSSISKFPPALPNNSPPPIPSQNPPSLPKSLPHANGVSSTSVPSYLNNNGVPKPNGTLPSYLKKTPDVPAVSESTILIDMTVEQRLDALEKKLDKILSHLGIA